MKNLRLRTVLAAVVACVLAVTMYAAATSSGWIFLGGPIGDQGAGTPPLGESDIVLASTSSPHVATSLEYRGLFLNVTSSVTLTSPVTIQLPLQSGTGKIVLNNTTGGQDIRLAGPTGGFAAVANATLAVVGSDGTNFYAVSGGGGGGGFDAAAIPNILPILSGYLHADGATIGYQNTVPVSDLVGVLAAANGGTGLSAIGLGYLYGDGAVLAYHATIPVTDLTGVLGAANGGTGLNAPCAPGTYLTGDGGVYYCSAAYVSPPPGSDIEAGAAGILYDIGWAGIPLAGSSFLPPTDQAVPYYAADAGLWRAAPLAFSGDISCTGSGNSFTCTVLAATGTGSNPFDSGGALFNIAATAQCLDSTSTSPWCATEGKISFTDTTTWQTIIQRPVAVNENLHEYLTFCADDYSGDGGSSIKNFGCGFIQVHVTTDTVATFFVPGAGSDFSTGPETLNAAGATTLTGCTTNNTDAGCTPGANLSTLFDVRSQVSSGLVQTQVRGTNLTRFPWKGTVLGSILRRNP